MANVVVGLPRRDARPHRQQGPRAIQRLDLTLFIQAEHERVVGRIQIETDNVTHFLDKLRVGRQLEGLDAVRLQAERSPDARNSGFRHADDLSHARVVHCVAWGGGAFQRPRNHVHDEVVGRVPRSRRAAVHRPSPPAADAKPFAPLADTVTRDAQVPRHRLVR